MRSSSGRAGGVAAASLVLALCGAAANVRSAPPAPFDPDAVAAGRTAYAARCASCHGPALTGGGAPSLNSPSFASRWLGSAASIQALDGALRSMPKGAPGSLPDRAYAAIKTYIMSANANRAKVSVASAGAPAVRLDLPAPPASVTAATTATPGKAELLEPADGDWPMYNRTYGGQRFSPLTQITAANAGQLQVACILQVGEPGTFMTSPLVYKGVGYVTSVHDVIAFDAATCARKWTYAYTPADREPIPGNRGAALYDGKIFRGTTDGHLLALDAATGALLWDVHVSDSTQGAFVGAAPIVYDGLVIVGLAGGDFGAPGHIYAFDADSGRRVWTFDSIPTGKEPGAETWKKGAQYGGGSTWTAFGADPKAGLILAPVGNPAPDLMTAARPGDNLYTNSVVALDGATGRLAWYVQQNPADFHDWDTAAPPVAYEQDGRRYLAVGSKDGNVYLYDRDSRRLLAKTPVTTITNPDVPLSVDKAVHVCPAVVGGVEWNGPAYSPAAKAMFVGSVDRCADFKLAPSETTDTPGSDYFDGSYTLAPPEEARGWLKALDGASGRELWSWHAPAPMVGGVTPTAGGVVLTGCSNGDFLVFDAKTGAVLYKFATGGAIGGGVTTYEAAGRQYIAVASGNAGGMTASTPGAPTLVVFALRP